MEPRKEGWNIVVLGSWNASIFSPNWVSEYLFDKTEVQVEFPLTPGLSPRYTHGGVMVHLEGERLIVELERADEECLESAETMVVLVLGLLPHTPVRAIGVNFSYVEENASSDIQRMFQHDCSEALLGSGYTLGNQQIARDYASGGRTLHFTTTLTKNGAAVFDFNYHWDVKNAGAAVEAVKGQSVQLEHSARGLLDVVCPKTNVEVRA